MVKNILLLILGAVLIFRIPSADFSQEAGNELQISIPQIETLRQILIDNTMSMLPNPYAGLLLGMVIGEKGEIPYNFNQTLKNTGVVHVVVVSGQNLTLLAGFILGFAQYLGRRKTIWASIVIVVFYLFLTGFQVPVIRAAIMFFATSFAKLYGRENDGVRVLILTALSMLIVNPLWLISISFQLSFLATIGVVILAPVIIKNSQFIPEVLRQDLCVTIAAQILTAPIIAFYFNQFSLAGLLVNILVLWTIPFIMISGALALIISFINLTIAAIFVLIPKLLLVYFVAVIEIFNKPWASTYIHTFSWLQLAGFYVTILAIYLWLKQNTADSEDEEIDTFHSIHT